MVFVSRQHSLVVMRTKHLRWLGLRSLKEVSAGNVMLKDNLQLCYTQPFQWKRLFKTDQEVTIQNNKPAELCGEYVRVRAASRQHRRLSRVQLAKRLRTTGPTARPFRVSHAIRQFEPLVVGGGRSGGLEHQVQTPNSRVDFFTGFSGSTTVVEM